MKRPARRTESGWRKIANRFQSIVSSSASVLGALRRGGGGVGKKKGKGREDFIKQTGDPLV